MNFVNITLFSILLISIARTSLQCHSNDLKSLNDFSNCITSKIDGWNNNTTDCCSWPGVTCDNSSVSSTRVIGLELPNKKLAGRNCDFGAGLDELRVLNLSHNFLEGFLPVKLFSIQNLQVLDLSDNYFSGSVAVEGYMPAIRYLDISRNKLTGSISSTLCENSSFIHTLNLGSNYFKGEIPMNFQKCTSLWQLFLYGNDLSGTFPESLLQLRDLRALRLQYNSFSGPLIDGIGNLSSLVELDVSFNRFSGALPDHFGRLRKLKHFFANSNRFAGDLPKSLGNSPSLQTLNLSNNTLEDLSHLNCSAVVNLTFMDLGSNKFNGPVPESISSCKRLGILSLGRNQFTGEIPYSFKNLQALTFLSLSNVSLTNISSALEILQNCKSLTTLILTLSFRGEEMPNHMNLQFTNLKILALGVCQLQGPVPLWLNNCKKLQLLDLSLNQFSGRIPSWMGDFNSLFYLDLSNNSFIGEIPKSLTRLQRLASKNMSIEGHILGLPLFKQSNSRRSLQYNKVESFQPTLDLSNNKLSGPIWPSFGNLKRLHVLRLKNNSLSGGIPDSISEITDLEILDLSSNNLSGEIPSSFGRLTFLSEFSVADNQLYGRMPTGGQLMTFSCSSFENNNGLYGDGGVFASCNPTELPPAPAPALPQVDAASEKMTIMGLQFAVGAATGFVLTVYFCFLSGWVFSNTRRKKSMFSFLTMRRYRH
ncbi:phytosulfokin receptor 1 [Euphorbia peplus]|nr:phytosulfokin receptor 1 [Euphorbia peplus]